MTNKLPKIGQRYRHIIKGYEVKIIHNNSITYKDEDSGCLHDRLLDEFLEYFEELPEDNSQQTEQVKVTENAVDKALEEIKATLAVDICYTNARYQKLVAKTQNLIRALEAEKAETKIKFTISESKPSKENFPSMYCAEEKPQSIWKDVSELPEGDVRHYIFQLKSGDYFLGGFCHNGNKLEPKIFHEDIDFFPNDMRGYVVLTDFINAFEQMQQDIEDIKTKLEGK